MTLFSQIHDQEKHISTLLGQFWARLFFKLGNPRFKEIHNYGTWEKFKEAKLTSTKKKTSSKADPEVEFRDLELPLDEAKSMEKLYLSEKYFLLQDKYVSVILKNFH